MTLQTDQSITRNVIVVIGGQYGSEAKGKHIQDLCHSRPEINAVVRTGAPNAGHSMAIFDGDEEEGIKYVVMQILPCGWTAENIKALYVGAGAQIIPDLLTKEILLVDDNSKATIYIDGAAMIQTEGDAQSEVGESMSAKVGSTSKGCGAALIRRISRNDPNYVEYRSIGISRNVAEMLNKYDHETILVEGTQGCGLSLFHGQYPFTTSRDTGAAVWLSEAGLSPMQVGEIHMVCRTYPIRVAGNSGQMKGELCWSYFFKKAGLDKNIIQDFTYCKAMYEEQNADPRELVKQVCISMKDKHGDAWKPFSEIMEYTTVTKLPRRIGMFDYEEFERAVMMNRPTHVALEFCNYVTAEHYGIFQVTPLTHFVDPVKGAPIKFGRIEWDAISTLMVNDWKLDDLLYMINEMNRILAKWCNGHVTHLGISRDSTLEILYP